ncbi:hypothetical protein J2X31_002513 [Flavobacterium arsenatis]|uniref:Uncharacterized protein n=1 Tax=Flavobacterium arsenatis TaxID=1484332 RepID=A0ABU1TRL0_9FLAO|nr:hypothetical protein [Flavobacterium arsenatis]MDR6968490.1 hypothetical protein [Flavobacterium arsenatis]
MYETLGPRNKQNYHRLSPNLVHASTEMDDTSPRNIKNLIQDGLKYVSENKKELDLIVKKIIKNK